jgi:hypothetical protein
VIERNGIASLSFKDVGTNVAVAGHIETTIIGTVTLSSQTRKGLVFMMLVTKK